jgi:hypothetical protein
MQRTDQALAWMALSRAPALDVAILSRAFESLGGVHGLINSSDAARRSAGVPEAALKFLCSASAQPSPVEQAWIEDPKHDVLPFTARAALESDCALCSRQRRRLE